MSSLLTTMVAPMANVTNSLRMSDTTKKNVATAGVLSVAGVGAVQISKRTLGKRFSLNTRINKYLKGLADKAGNLSKKDCVMALCNAENKVADSIRSVASKSERAAGNIAGKLGKSKIGIKIGEAIKSVVKKGSGVAGKLATKLNKDASLYNVGVFAESVLKKGGGLVKKVANSVAKTSGRQKLLGALAVGTIGAVMAVREHFSKKEGAASANEKAAVHLSATRNQLAANSEYMAFASGRIRKLELDNAIKDEKIAKLEFDNDMKSVEIDSQKKSIDAIEKAAEKLGYANELAAELQKNID